MNSATVRAALVRRAGISAEVDLALASRCMEQVGRGELQGALICSQLAGRARALGRYQIAPDLPGAGIEPGMLQVRRLTGGVDTLYGDGILSLCLIAPDPWSWIEARGARGDRLLNRYVRGFLPGIAALGVSPMYGGRDFLSVAGRRVAYITAERDSRGAFLLQLIVGIDRSYDPGPDRPVHAGLPAPPASGPLVAELSNPSDCAERLSDALIASCGSHFGLTWDEGSEAISPDPSSELLPAPPSASDLRGPVEIPIGQLYARAEFTAEGRISEVALLGDWIAGSGDVQQLEQALVGLLPEEVAAFVRRWFADPQRLAIGLTSHEPIVELLRPTWKRSGVSTAALR